MAAISDRDSKQIFLDQEIWPKTTSLFSLTRGDWIQCRPRRDGTNFQGVTFPHLHTAGSSEFWIDPDCFYIRVSGADLSRSCDVISVEVSNVNQNFQQKRGRYVGTESAMFVNLPAKWLSAPVDVRKRYGDYLFPEERQWLEDRKVPIRTIRVMYFLDPAYFKTRITSVDPRPWEYFLPNSSLRSLTSGRMRDFVRAISPDAQFYGWN